MDGELMKICTMHDVGINVWHGLPDPSWFITRGVDIWWGQGNLSPVKLRDHGYSFPIQRIRRQQLFLDVEGWDDDDERLGHMSECCRLVPRTVECAVYEPFPHFGAKNRAEYDLRVPTFRRAWQDRVIAAMEKFPAIRRASNYFAFDCYPLKISKPEVDEWWGNGLEHQVSMAHRFGKPAMICIMPWWASANGVREAMPMEAWQIVLEIVRYCGAEAIMLWPDNARQTTTGETPWDVARPYVEAALEALA